MTYQSSEQKGTHMLREWSDLYSDYENGRGVDIDRLLALSSDLIASLAADREEAERARDDVESELMQVAEALNVDIENIAANVGALSDERHQLIHAIMDAHNAEHVGALTWCRTGACVVWSDIWPWVSAS